MKKSTPPKPSSSPATSVSPPRVLLTKRFVSLAGKRSPAEIDAVNGVLQALPSCWGKPHAHSGYALRRLAPGLYDAMQGAGFAFPRHPAARMPCWQIPSNTVISRRAIRRSVEQSSVTLATRSAGLSVGSPAWIRTSVSSNACSSERK